MTLETLALRFAHEQAVKTVPKTLWQRQDSLTLLGQPRTGYLLKANGEAQTRLLVRSRCNELPRDGQRLTETPLGGIIQERSYRTPAHPHV